VGRCPLRRRSRASHDDFAAAVATIRAFSDADLNVARAAQQLHVHPNTVRYRVQQIATKTGHDPRTFSGLVELICILEMDDRSPTAAAFGVGKNSVSQAPAGGKSR
jgi:sugar diacid utilization regulator